MTCPHNSTRVGISLLRADWRGETQRARLKGFARLRAVFWSRSLKLYQAWALREVSWFKPLMRALKHEFAGVDLHDPCRVGSESRIFGETPVLTVVKLLGVVEEGGPRQLLDLGSGRGTVVLAAAASGFTALGLELEADWVIRAQRVAKRLDLPAEFRCADFLEEDWPAAAVVFVVATAFPEEVRAEILERVRRLQPGSYLIAGDWPGLHSLDLVWQGPLPVDWGVIPFSVYRIGEHMP